MQHTVFFFNDTATTEIYTLSLHDALPILTTTLRSLANLLANPRAWAMPPDSSWTLYVSSQPKFLPEPSNSRKDRKSTRLNSSHANISYAVFCLKKKKAAPSTCQRHLSPSA